jgi:hypothetical protein
MAAEIRLTAVARTNADDQDAATTRLVNTALSMRARADAIHRPSRSCLALASGFRGDFSRYGRRQRVEQRVSKGNASENCSVLAQGLRAR